MKKTISLFEKVEGWKSFTFEKIEDIKNELMSRNISIGVGTIIGDRVKIGYGAIIENWAKIGDGAKIGYDAKIERTLYITGSRHVVIYWGENKINIGCKKYSIDEWKKHFKSIGESEGYTPEEIEEYREYIEFIAKIHKTWNINQ